MPDILELTSEMREAAYERAAAMCREGGQKSNLDPFGCEIILTTREMPPPRAGVKLPRRENIPMDIYLIW